MKQKRRSKRLLHPDTVVFIKQILLGLFVIGLVTLCIVGIWHGTRLPAVTISEVEVRGGETINHQILEDRIWTQLDGTYLKLIPRRFTYLYPKQDIIASIANIDRVKDLTLERTGRKKLVITFDEYQSEALWCTDTEEQCIFIDENTFAFAPAPQLKGGTFRRYVTTDKNPSLGQTILTAPEKDTLDTVLQALNEKRWLVRRIDVDSAKDAYLLLTAGGEIKISLKEDGYTTADNLANVLSSEEFNELTPGEFRYIDLRFGNKVFVNRTFDEIVATSTEEGLVEFSIVPEVPTTSSSSEITAIEATTTVPLEAVASSTTTTED